MSFLIPAALGALGGLFGGKQKRNEERSQYEMAQMQRGDAQQSLRRRQRVLSMLFSQYGMNPNQWGFGNPLNEQGQAVPGATGAEDNWTLSAMPEFRGGSWLSDMAGGALGGLGNYFQTKPASPFEGLTPRSGAPRSYRGGSTVGGGRGYQFSGV